MIKKAVLLTTVAPFLMVFSNGSFSFDISDNPYFATMSDISAMRDKYSEGRWSLRGTSSSIRCSSDMLPRRFDQMRPNIITSAGTDSQGRSMCSVYAYVGSVPSAFYSDPSIYNVSKTDEACASSDDSQYATTNFSVANHLMSGGSALTNGGACSVSLSGVNACPPYSENYYCELDIISVSTGEVSSPEIGVQGGLSFQPGMPLDEFPIPDYLSPLPGACSDSGNCVTIGDTSYLIDWDTAPDWFSYVDNNGNTVTNPNAGGGSGGGDPTDPTNPTDPTDPGGNDGGDSGGSDGGNGSGDGSDDGSGGSSGGGSSGGGSTVPDFEFDESGIIEAIRSSGQSNRNAIDALSNDVTGSINNQTNELNSTINTEASRLITETDRQTGRVTTAITSQTQSVQHTLDNQTRSLNSTLEGLQSSLVDALGNIQVRFSGGGGSGGGSSEGGGDGDADGEDGFWDGLVDSLAGLFGSGTSEAADGFASGLEETTSDEAFGEFDQQGYAEELFDTYESEQIGLLEERVEALLDMVDSGLSPYRNLISRLIPAVPSSSCTPIVFGSGHMSFTIDCEGFNLLKAMLAWVLYVFTAYTIVSTIFSYRSGAQQGA